MAAYESRLQRLEAEVAAVESPAGLKRALSEMRDDLSHLDSRLSKLSGRLTGGLRKLREASEDAGEEVETAGVPGGGRDEPPILPTRQLRPF